MKILWFMMKLIAIALLTVTLVANRLLPIEILVAIGIIEIALLILVWKRKVLQIFVVLIMLVTASGLTYVEYVAGQIINYDPTVENTISFFALKDSKVNTIAKAVKNESRIGVSTLLSEKIDDFIREQLATKEYTKDLITFEGIQIGLEDFYEGELDILAVDQGYLSSVIQYDPLFLENTKVIWSVEKTSELINLPEASVTKEPFVVYIAGVDNRDEFTAFRADTNIIMVVNPLVNKITIVSVPRDAYVQLGCISRTALDKLTHAGVYGIDCSISTLEKLLGVSVNYYARTYFETFNNLVGALGTIEVYNEKKFEYKGWIFNEGIISLNKMNALIYARDRKSVEGGDQQRAKNQQEVLKGFINKLLEPATLTKIESIIQAVSGTVDTNMTGDEIFALVRRQIMNMDGWTFDQITVTGSDATKPSYAMGGRELFMVILDKEKLEEAKAKLQAALAETK